MPDRFSSESALCALLRLSMGGTRAFNEGVEAVSNWDPSGQSGPVA